jgi:hypothetical protein
MQRATLMLIWHRVRLVLCWATIRSNQRQRHWYLLLLWLTILFKERESIVVVIAWYLITSAISAYHQIEPRSWRWVLDTTLCDKARQWFPTGQWFSLYSPVSYTNETNRHDIAEILLIVASNSIIHIIINDMKSI